MTLHDLLFSNEHQKKISRHLLFWFCWFMYMTCTQLRNQTPQDIGMKSFIIYQLAVSANRVLLQIFFCYTIMYFLMPRFLKKKKYREFAALLVMLLFCIYWITYLDYIYVWSDTTSPIFFNVAHVKALNQFQSKYFAIYSNLHFTGLLVSCGIIFGVKYYKSWYTHQRENAVLIDENSQAELQLLKAQVHPHFLFNTLNNIYSLTLDDSPKAATTVKKLSGMVKYMINEGAETFVPVSKEIKMLLDYIGLERIRYGNRLEMTLEIRHNLDDNRLIAPLLMIPFVENCFKHGASKTIDKARIDLFIETGNEWLEFKISNGQPAMQTNENKRKKIGLLNVQKRLELIYPGTHQLEVRSSEKLFEVNMKVRLESQKVVFNQPEKLYR